MEKIEMLNLIKAADEAYYKKSAPVMSDAEYDVLRKQFIELYGETELNYVPTDADSADFVHPHEVISLAKVKAGDDATLVAWLTKSADDGTTFMPVHLQKKLDGCTVVTYKINGKLVVVSRGDGKQGKILANIPAKYSNALDFSSAYPVRSEAIFTKSDFDEICKEQIAQGLEPFKNIRNAVSGVLQSKECSPYLDRVTFVAYDLMGCPMSVAEKLGYIEDHTQYSVVGSRVYKSVEAIKEDLPKLFEEWNSGDEPIDGVVVKSNVHDSLKLFGSTGHHPLDSFAYKAVQEGAVTTLNSIEWQVGREKITAVAHFDPVQIDGTTVEKASVANMSIIREKGLSIGAKILVIKSNQIIPYVEKVLEPGYLTIEVPKTCPVCGHELSEKNGVLFCANDACKGRLSQNIEHMCSKKVLNIKGLSESTITKLIDRGLVRTPLNLFTLTEQDFLLLDGIKEKSAKNLVEAIRKGCENVDLAHLVAACCVPGIGLTVGELLAEKFGTYDALSDALYNGYDFTQIDGIGEVTNTLLLSDEFFRMFCHLKKYLTVVDNEPVTESASGKSYTFVITGKLSKPRSHFEELFKSKGHKVAGSVSKNTDYLLCEDKNSQSTKAKKARTLGVSVISENELADLL